MNAAARALIRGPVVWERGRMEQWPLSLIGVVLLIVIVLASALSVIYVKSIQRNLYSELQASEQERDKLQTQWRRLLLEENTWAAPERVQALAQQALGMQVLHTRDIVLLANST
jgi:cell division protein FtsL